jgi:hypothetical protein
MKITHIYPKAGLSGQTPVGDGTTIQEVFDDIRGATFDGVVVVPETHQFTIEGFLELLNEGRYVKGNVQFLILQGRPYLYETGNFKVVDADAAPRKVGAPGTHRSSTALPTKVISKVNQRGWVLCRRLVRLGCCCASCSLCSPVCRCLVMNG